MWISKPELTSLLGQDGAERLMLNLGGRDLYVPITPNAEHYLAYIIGLPALKVLCTSFGGERITPPNGKFEPQKEKILALLLEGVPKASIASTLGVTERYVYMVASLDSKEKQLTLPL